MVHKQDNPIVYLPGFDSGHLVNLVQFIYQGKCQVKAELLEEFLNCGKSLGVANLAEYFQAKGNDEVSVLASIHWIPVYSGRGNRIC